MGTGPLEAELQQTARVLGVREKVRFFGDIGDAELPLYYHACDVFVFPSITPNEAFGLAQVEAMACGKPVVACQLRSGVPYITDNGLAGLTVPPTDPDSLAAAIRTLLNDLQLRRQLGDYGRKRAFSEFSEPVMVERYWKLIQELTSRSPADSV